MKTRIVAIYISIIILPALAIAQNMPEDSGTILDKLGHMLHDIPASAVMSVIAAVEFLLRIVPTKAPISLLVPLKKAMDMLIYILGYLSELLAKLVVVANKVK